MKTIAQAVAYLVAQGKPENLAKAAMNEGYNYEVDATLRQELLSKGLFCHEAGLLYGWDDNGDEFNPIDESEEGVLAMYDTMVEMMLVTEQGITINNELVYDCNGNHL